MADSLDTIDYVVIGIYFIAVLCVGIWVSDVSSLKITCTLRLVLVSKSTVMLTIIGYVQESIDKDINLWCRVCRT